MQRLILLPILFIILAILQATFFSHFAIKHSLPNIVLLFFVLICFLKKNIAKTNFLHILAILAGMFLDFFSSTIFGLYTLIFLALSFSIQKLLILLAKKNFLTFSLLLLFALLFFQLGQLLFFLIFEKEYLSFNLVELIYNFILGVIFYSIYVVYKKTIKSQKKRN
jgi:rod shape-determining protein MreD